MTRVALLNARVVQADAVANDVLGMYQALANRGHDVRVFAERWDGAADGVAIAPAGELPAFLNSSSPKKNSAVLIYHHSDGWPPGPDLFRRAHRARCRRVVKYHNVTPPEFFNGLSAAYRDYCLNGQRERDALARAGADLYLCDSSFNRNDLLRAGADPGRSRVVAPFHHADELLAVEADPGLLQACRDGKTNVLTVGRVAPNKGHAELIDAFAVYHHEHNPNSRLLIAGKEDRRLGAYTARVHARVLEQGLLADAVVFLGEVTLAELKALYLAAHVFLITSRHEGFCVPLVECMALKVPVVAGCASGCGAVAETVGGAGLVWDDPAPDLLAASVQTAAGDGAVSAGLADLGWRRYRAHFARHRIEAALVQALDGLL
jgi:glycosyltransferase involved in cell wall biosynthesis